MCKNVSQRLCCSYTPFVLSVSHRQANCASSIDAERAENLKNYALAIFPLYVPAAFSNRDTLDCAVLLLDTAVDPSNCLLQRSATASCRAICYEVSYNGRHLAFTVALKTSRALRKPIATASHPPYFVDSKRSRTAKQLQLIPAKHKPRTVSCQQQQDCFRWISVAVGT